MWIPIFVCLQVLILMTHTNGRASSEETFEQHHFYHYPQNFKSRNEPKKVVHQKQKLPLVLLTKDQLTDAMKTSLGMLMQKHHIAKFSEKNSQDNAQTETAPPEVRDLVSDDNLYFLHNVLKNDDWEDEDKFKNQRGRLPKRGNKHHIKLQSNINDKTPLFLDAITKLNQAVNKIGDNLILTNTILSQNEKLAQRAKYNEAATRNTRIYSNRRKRDLSSHLEIRNNTAVRNSTIISDNKRPVDINATKSKDEHDKDANSAKIEDTTAENDIKLEPSGNNAKECENCKDSNSRRSYNEASSTVKGKLLGYLDLTYNEILNKLHPLSKIRELFVNDDIYKIGYILANIDTLEANIKILKKDMDENKNLWTDERILEHFDKLMVSNKVITNLVEALNSYTNKNSAIDDLSRLLPDSIKEIS